MPAPPAENTHSAGTVRIAPIASIPQVLKQLGFEPAEILAELNLDIRLFDDLDTVIPYALRTRLLNQCAETTGCQHFGHLMARNTGSSSFGIAGFLIQQSPDVVTALRSFVRYLRLHVSGAVVYLDEGPESAFFGYSTLEPQIEASEQLADSAVTAAFNIMCELCGPKWCPSEVCFAHRRPKSIRPFKEYFDAPLSFNEGRNGVAFPARWLQMPLTGADPDLYAFLQSQAELLQTHYAVDFAEQVRRVLRSAVLMHQATAANISDLFCIHQRTLNRRLRGCGTCFRELLDETRFGIAQQLLMDSSMDITEIAATLDYADTSAFARAFRRQSGKSPSAWRHQYRLE